MFRREGEHIWIRDAEGYSDRPNVGYVKGENLSLLFESGASGENAEEIRRDLSFQGLSYPSFVVVSHWHWDHSFGLFSWSCPTIAGKETNRELRHLSSLPWDIASIDRRVEKREEIVFCREMMNREYRGNTEGIKVVPASIEFENCLEINLGGVRCSLIHTGGPHSRDSVVLLVHEDRFLFLGDSAGKDLYTYPWNFSIDHEEDFLQNIETIPWDQKVREEFRKTVSNLEFERCIPGHSGTMERSEFLSSFTS